MEKRQEPVIRILLVDDQPAVRHGLKMRLGLERDLAVVGEANNGAEALVLAGLLSPDVIVMDIEMGKMNGLAATGELSITCPAIAVVMLSIHGGSETHRQAIEAGAAGFVEKRGGAAALLDEIRRVARSATNRERNRSSG